MKFKKDNLRKAFDKCLAQLDKDQSQLTAEVSAGVIKVIAGTLSVSVTVEFKAK